jgi:MFS family permease
MGSPRIPYRRNYFLALIMECSWAAGVWMSHPFTVIPNFLIRLGASTALIGIVPAVRIASMGVGMFLISAAAGQRRRLAPFMGKRRYVAICGFVGLGTLALVASEGLVPYRLIIVAALGCMVVIHAFLPGQLPMYFVLLSRSFPERLRHKMFGALFSVATFVALGGVYISSIQFAGGGDGFVSYSKVFFGSCVLFLLGSVTFFFMRERETEAVPHRTPAMYLSILAEIWEGQPIVRRYIVARLWTAAGILAMVFLATYSREEAGLSEHAITMLGYVSLGVQGVATYLLGWMSSPKGLPASSAAERNVKVMMFSAAFVLGSVFFAAVGPGLPAAIYLAAAIGMIVASDLALSPNVLMTLAPAKLRTDIVALGTIVPVPVVLFVPPVCGFVIEAAGHRPVFLVLSILSATGLVKLNRLVRDLRGTGAPRAV